MQHLTGLLLVTHVASAFSAFLITLGLRYVMGSARVLTKTFFRWSAWMLWSSFALLVGTGVLLRVLEPVPFDLAFTSKLVLVAAMGVAGGIVHARLRQRMAHHLPHAQDAVQRVPEDLS